jgi:hypothetical protein
MTGATHTGHDRAAEGRLFQCLRQEMFTSKPEFLLRGSTDARHG